MASQGLVSQIQQSGVARTVNLDSNTWYRLSCQIKALEVTTDPNSAQKSYILEMKDALSSSIGQSWQISRQLNGAYQFRTKLLGSSVYLDVDNSRSPAAPRLSHQPLLGWNWMIDPWPDNSLSTSGVAFLRIWNLASGNSSYLNFDPQNSFLSLDGGTGSDNSGGLWLITPVDTVNNFSYSSTTLNTANLVLGINTTSPPVYTKTKIQTITSSSVTDTPPTLTLPPALPDGDLTSLPAANSSIGAPDPVTLENSPGGISTTGIVGIGLGASMGLLVTIALIVICLKQRRYTKQKLNIEAIDPVVEETIKPAATEHNRRSEFGLNTLQTNPATAISPVSPIDANAIFPTHIPIPNVAELEQYDPRGVSPIPRATQTPVRSWDSIVPKNKRPVELDIRSSRL